MKFGFIIGTGRCGTTLLAKMLNSNPEICVPPELQILVEESGNGHRLNEIFESGDNAQFGAEDFIHLIRARCPYRLQEYFDFEGFFRSREYPEKNLNKLAADFFAAIASSKGKSCFIEQTPWYGQHISVLNALFPKAKYIHVIRDGRDVAISFARTPWWSDDIVENLLRWEQEVSTILRDSSEFLNPEQVLEVRYENLVQETKKTLTDICRFMEVQFHDSMLDPSTYIRYKSFSKDNMDEISSSALYGWEKSPKKPTFTESVYAWKNYKHVDFYSAGEKVESLLSQFGYDQSPLVMQQDKQKFLFLATLKKLVKSFLSPNIAVNLSPLKEENHAMTDPFFDSLLRQGYRPLHIVDVGANRGNWTRTALKYFPDSYYTLFEPQEKMRHAVADLTENPRVKFYAMGAGPENSIMKLTEHDRDDSLTFALDESQAFSLGRKQINIPVVALDDFLAENQLPKVDILKIDAEGWDLEVVKGAQKTIQNAEVVLIEAAVMNKLFKNKVYDVICEMERRNFTLFDITDLNRTIKHNALWLVELAFIKRGGSIDMEITSYI